MPPKFMGQELSRENIYWVTRFGMRAAVQELA